jgi:YD repeat-containing protein
VSWIERTVRDPQWRRPDPRRQNVEQIPSDPGVWRSRAPGCLLGDIGQSSYSDRIFRPERAETLMSPTIKYRPEDNAAYIRLSQGKVLESAEVAQDVVFDYDAQGRIVGIELLDAKAQLSPELLIEAA